MKTKLSAKQMKSPDKLLKVMLEFFGYLRHNVKLYLVFAGIIVLITATVVSINHFTEKRENNARKTLYELGHKIQKLNPEQKETAMDMIEKELPILGNTKAGIEARYMLAEMYYNNKNWTKAISHYELLTNKAKGLIQELAYLGLAYSAENNGDVKKALDSFTKVKELNSPVYADVAMMGTARCYQKLGDKVKAGAMYESVIIAYPDTDVARLASVAKASL
ncbi:MAG: tetratricopeptide repeat protein [bacterium]